MRTQGEARNRQLTEETLATVIPQINEANLICKELKQPLRFEVKGSLPSFSLPYRVLNSLPEQS